MSERRVQGRPALDSQAVDEFKQKICRAALRIISEQGKDGLSFRALARDIGSSHTRVHHYFANKEELLLAVRDYAFGLFADDLERSRQGQGTRMDKLRASGRAYFDFAHKDPEAFGVLFGDFTRQSQERSGNQKRAWLAIREPIAEAVALSLVAGDPDVLTYVFWSALHGVTTLSLSGNVKDDVDIDDVLESTFMGLGRGHSTATGAVNVG